MVKAIKSGATRPGATRRRAASGGTFLDYAQPALLEMHIEMQKRGALAGDCSPLRKAFWDTVEPKAYESDAALHHLDDYLRFLESRIEAGISQQSVIYFEHVYRRIAPKSGGSNEAPATILHMRGHLEAAIQKYGRLEACNKIAIASTVSPEKILKGRLTNSEMGRRIADEMRRDGQYVLTDFDIDDLNHIYELERTAYEIWRAMAVRRAVGKGAPLVVHPGNFEDGRSDELDLLLMSYDQRRSVWIASATGMVFDDRAQPRRKITKIPVPQYNVRGKPLSEMRPLLTSLGHSFHDDEKVETNFEWTPLDVSAFIAAHRPFFLAFEARHNVEASATILLAAAVSYVQALGWRDTRAFVRSFQRAGFGPATRQSVLGAASRVLKDLCGEWCIEAPTEASLNKAFDFWSLTSKRDHINVQNGGPHALFLPYGGDTWFVDCAWIDRRLHHLFFGLNVEDQSFKGEPLERYVRADSAPLPSAPCRAHNGESRQIDASFGVGDMLVIAECRAVNWSFAFERGDPEAIAFRIKKQKKALADADEKARWLKANPTGKNYDVTRFSLVLPIGISAFAEFIPSLDRSYWLTETIPRFLTPGELRRALADEALESVKASHPAIVVLR